MRVSEHEKDRDKCNESVSERKKSRAILRDDSMRSLIIIIGVKTARR